MTVPKSGPLTRAELLDVWKGALDRSFRDPLLEAGEGNGLEAHTQALAQLARVSEAIDTTTQAMFICPWSGQSNEPASGGVKATVTLTFSRTKLIDRPLVLGAGDFFIEEQTTDWGGEGGVEIFTGRRYVLTTPLVFNAGDVGPYTVTAEAELIGVGYNNPLPGTLRHIRQPGAQFENDLATVLVSTGTIAAMALVASNTVTVVTPNEPDTFVPEHVGQYVQFTSGANAGSIARIVQFSGPDLSVIPPVGSSVILEWTHSVEGTLTGSFTAGERITRGAVDLFGLVLAPERASAGSLFRMSYIDLASSPAIAPGDVLTGEMSGATLTVTTVLSGQTYVAEAPVGIVGGATWRILDWGLAWGLTVSNAESPAGGRAGWLDELGFERNFQRSPGEDDSTYRQRIKAIADVVTPNAIRRALSRTLGSIPWCFREVGTDGLPGFFYDGDNAPPSGVPHGALNDAYDYDTILLTGGPAVGTFDFQEAAELEDVGGDNYATGYMGRIDGGTSLVFIRRDGGLPSPLPAGVQVRGLNTGATFPVTAEVANPESIARRFRVYLDYSQFRGFFLVCLPPLGLGEFGFAYGDHPANAYDAPSPYLNFYDGFPYLNSIVYGRVQQAIDEVRAGGVLFDLCLDDGSCP